MSDELNLSNLEPAQPRQDRKRIGRGLGSGKGRYSGRGIKGQKSRAGSHKMPAGFEGGQMPIGPFRTYSQPVNVGDLEQRFEAGAEVSPETLKTSSLVRKLSVDVKVLGQGELTKQLTVTAHRFSRSAVEKIEAAGGTVIRLREPVEKKRKRHKAAAPVAEAPDAPDAEETEAEGNAAESPPEPEDEETAE